MPFCESAFLPSSLTICEMKCISDCPQNLMNMDLNEF